MTDLNIATLCALLDQELVDPEALETALDDPEARAALVDFVRMRRDVTGNPEPLPDSLLTLRRASLGGLAIRWSAAVALLVLVFLAGWMLPRTIEPDGQDDGPPQPVRVEKFVPGVDWSFK